MSEQVPGGVSREEVDALRAEIAALRAEVAMLRMERARPVPLPAYPTPWVEPLRPFQPYMPPTVPAYDLTAPPPWGYPIVTCEARPEGIPTG